MQRPPLVAMFLIALAVVFVTTDAMAFYSPQNGRFLQRDPRGTAIAPPTGRMISGVLDMERNFIPRNNFEESLQYADGSNLYQYVRSNPTRNFDPTGLFTSSKGCSEKQKKTLEQAEAAAGSAASTAYNLVRGKNVSGGNGRNGPWREVNAWKQKYNNYRWNEAAEKDLEKFLKNYAVAARAISKEGINRGRYAVECECYCLSTNLAYVNSGVVRLATLDFETIHFCPSFFEESVLTRHADVPCKT